MTLLTFHNESDIKLTLDTMYLVWLYSFLFLDNFGSHNHFDQSCLVSQWAFNDSLLQNVLLLLQVHFTRGRVPQSVSEIRGYVKCKISKNQSFFFFLLNCEFTLCLNLYYWLAKVGLRGHHWWSRGSSHSSYQFGWWSTCCTHRQVELSTLVPNFILFYFKRGIALNFGTFRMSTYLM
jgi:hypothetical protein